MLMHSFMSSVDLVLKDFGEKIRIPDLKLDDDQFCQLVFDKTIIVMIKHDTKNEKLILFSEVGEIAGNEDHVLALYQEICHANLLWTDTNYATLGVEKYSGSVLLSLALPAASLTLESLEKELETFVNTTQQWKTNIQSTKESALSSQPEELPAEKNIGLRL